MLIFHIIGEGRSFNNYIENFEFSKLKNKGQKTPKHGQSLEEIKKTGTALALFPNFKQKVHKLIILQISPDQPKS